MKENFLNDKYYITIDEKELCFDSEELLGIFYKENDFFETMRELSKKFNITENELAYILVRFVDDKKVLYDSRLSFQAEFFIQDLKNDTFYDTSYINHITKTNDDYLEKTLLDENFVNFIFRDMKEDYTKLEKAIYTYIKLCQTLTYDPMFFAHNQTGEPAQIHSNINRLLSINENNNTIVCYEFNQIFGKLLSMQGINYRRTGFYGNGHANLTFRADNFIVSADAITSVLTGDLFRAKINSNLIGLELINHKGNKQSFNESFEKVYADLKEKNMDNRKIFNQLLDAYKNISSKEEVSIVDKLDIINAKIKNIKLEGMDKIDFVNNIMKKFFPTEIQNGNFIISIINKKVEGKTTLYPTLIVTYGDSFKQENIDKIHHLELDMKDNTLKEISHHDLISYLGSGRYNYINKEDYYRHTIPATRDSLMGK
ncbi:MAG: hypothetical protein IJ008_03400 [Clostridia bacterium]|nr:hypothetical protein [Clostridia bacterium]